MFEADQLTFRAMAREPPTPLPAEMGALYHLVFMLTVSLNFGSLEFNAEFISSLEIQF